MFAEAAVLVMVVSSASEDASVRVPLSPNFDQRVRAADRGEPLDPPGLEVAPAEVPVDEPLRIRRVTATLIAGAATIGIPMGVAWGFHKNDPPCSFFTGTPCSDAWASLTAGITPVLFAGGIGLAHELFGGKAGVGFGLAGALLGYLTAMASLGIFALAYPAPVTSPFGITSVNWSSWMPVAGAALVSVMTLTGAVVGLEWRHLRMESGASPWSLGRAFAEGAVFLFPVGLVETAVVFLSLGLFNRDAGALIAAMTLGTAFNAFGGLFAAWGVHRAMGGTAPAWAPFLGLLASGALASLFYLVHVPGPLAPGLTIGSTAIAPVLTYAGIIGLIGPSVALEWAGATPAPPERKRDDDWTSQLQIQPGVGFAPGGATLGFSGRF